MAAWDLFLAAKAGDAVAVRNLADLGCRIDMQDWDDRQIIHMAANYGHSDLLKYLLEAGADKNIPDKWLVTPLHEACMNNHVAAAVMLLDAGADLGVRNKEGKTPLECASEELRAKLIEKSLKHVCWELFHASRAGNLETLRHLVEGGRTQLDVVDWDGRHPLHLASEYGHCEVASWMLQMGCDKNIQDRWGVTPLMEACKHDRQNIAVVLVEAGCDLSLKDETGRVAFDFAPQHLQDLLAEKLDLRNSSIRGDLELVRKILETRKRAEGPGAVDAAGEDGSTALMCAAKGGQAEVAKYLLAEGAKKDHQNNKGETAVHWCFLGERADNNPVLQVLIDAGADITVSTELGVTPLSLALRQYLEKRRCAKQVKLLLERGSRFNPQESNFKELLREAIESNNTSFFQLLQECSVSLYNHVLNDVFFNSCKYAADDVMLLCLQAGVSIAVVDSNGRTGLHFAAEQGHSAVIRSLIEDHHADLNAQDKDGVSALFLAAKNRHTAAAYTLLKNNPSADFSNPVYSVLLSAAVEGDDYQCAGLLVVKGVQVTEEVAKLVEAKVEEKGVEMGDLGQTGDLTRRFYSIVLFRTAEQGRVSCVNLLLRSGVAADFTNQDGQNALHVASANGHAGVVECLVQNQAQDVNASDCNNTTALHLACLKGHTEVARTLILGGASLNLMDNNRYSALSLAIQNRHLDCTTLLCRCNGVDCLSVDKDGMSPYDWALVEATVDRYMRTLSRSSAPQTDLHVGAHLVNQLIPVPQVARLRVRYALKATIPEALVYILLLSCLTAVAVVRFSGTSQDQFDFSQAIRKAFHGSADDAHDGEDVWYLDASGACEFWLYLRSAVSEFQGQPCLFPSTVLDPSQSSDTQSSPTTTTTTTTHASPGVAVPLNNSDPSVTSPSPAPHHLSFQSSSSSSSPASNGTAKTGCPVPTSDRYRRFEQAHVYDRPRFSLLGTLRLRQVRTKSCRLWPPFDSSIHRCSPDFSPSTESITPYGLPSPDLYDHHAIKNHEAASSQLPTSRKSRRGVLSSSSSSYTWSSSSPVSCAGLQYPTNETIRAVVDSAFEYQPRSGDWFQGGSWITYSPSGFLVDLPTDALDTTAVLDGLQLRDWVDSQTAAIMLEFVIYSPSLDVTGVGRTLFEFLPTGAIQEEFNVRIMSLARANSPLSIFLLFLEAVCVLTLVRSAVEITKTMRIQRLRYFLSLFNWYELAVDALFITFMALRIQWFFLMSKVDFSNSTPSFLELHNAAENFAKQQDILAVLLALSWLKLAYYLKLFPVSGPLLQSIIFTFSSSSVFTLLFIIFTVIVAFALGFHLGFAGTEEMFKTLSNSLLNVFLFTFKEYKPNMREQVENRAVIGPLLYVMYFMVGTLILMNLSVGVCVESFEACQRHSMRAWNDRITHLMRDQANIRTWARTRLLLRRKQASGSMPAAGVGGGIASVGGSNNGAVSIMMPSAGAGRVGADGAVLNDIRTQLFKRHGGSKSRGNSRGPSRRTSRDQLGRAQGIRGFMSRMWALVTRRKADRDKDSDAWSDDGMSAITDMTSMTASGGSSRTRRWRRMWRRSKWRRKLRSFFKAAGKDSDDEDEDDEQGAPADLLDCDDEALIDQALDDERRLTVIGADIWAEKNRGQSELATSSRKRQGANKGAATGESKDELWRDIEQELGRAEKHLQAITSSLGHKMLHQTEKVNEMRQNLEALAFHQMQKVSLTLERLEGMSRDEKHDITALHTSLQTCTL